jgi:hypothetical protein
MLFSHILRVLSRVKFKRRHRVEEVLVRTETVQPLNLVQRGYQVVYHPGESNRCPGCGHSNWLIGRVSAQCGFCGTALALALSAPGMYVNEEQFALAS